MKKNIFLLLTFLLIYTSIFAQKKSSDYVTYYGKLQNTTYQILKQKEITIAYLGGSITNMDGWRALVSQKLAQKYPETKFKFINAGISSLGSLPHAFRLQKDLLDSAKVDLLFVESAVNDAVNGTNEKTQRRALEGVIRHALKANPYTDIVMMAFVDQDKIADYKAGKIPREVKVHEDIAKYYHLPFVNLAKEITERIDAGEFTWEKDFKNLHPSPFGQRYYTNTISSIFNESFEQDVQQQLFAHQFPPSLDVGNYNDGIYWPISKVRKNTGFKIIQKWEPQDSASTRQGFVDIPILEGKGNGANFELKFKGNTLGITVLSGPDAGVLAYEIDGKHYDPIDINTQYSKKLHLPRYLLLADDLGKGKHLLKLIVNQSKERTTGNVIRIPWFLVNNPK
ncbi:putative O-antigen related protein [Arcticibacter svalbardensis MN12-7]|uniref:Putative O-antigen related protein n=1 Tax=Arcticibacter svalbardensis MN12-7 TaxID=1150600 RepID=R9GPS4_9SPHI|nr:SGNH/GDSL hydrolase family protein [Arcticibacter svalbardensis]EOR93540.1 putative O-antigen related protein [Arcticibacter svalbardensis MN12-7]